MSISEDHQRAIECLKIHDVYLRSSRSTVIDDYEPLIETNNDCQELKFKHVVKESNVMVLEQENQAALKFFRVLIELGARWVAPSEDKDKNGKEIINAEIEAVMVAEYQIKGDPGQKGLKEFALKNASFHVWPYWREYLTAQSMRMNLPKLVIPAVQFAQNQDEDK